MDLLLAMVVWSLGAWLAYHLTRRTAHRRPGDTIAGPPRATGVLDARKEPRRRQEGMDVRRRRGQGVEYPSDEPDAASRRDFFRRVPSSADRPRPGPSAR